MLCELFGRLAAVLSLCPARRWLRDVEVAVFHYARISEQ
jgi:hypothetical protein